MQLFKRTNNNTKTVEDLIKDMSKGGTPGKVLKLDPTSGKLIASSTTDNNDDLIEITMDEGKMYVKKNIGISS